MTLKIYNITINRGFPDRTGRKGFQEVEVFADVLFEDKLFNLDVTCLLKKQDYKFDIWGEARDDDDYPEITEEYSRKAVEGFENHLIELYTVENLLKKSESLEGDCKRIIRSSQWDFNSTFKTKESILKEIENLQKTLSWFL